MDSFVLGFAFSRDRQQVLLISKKRPAWQAGFLNGIGGHIEPGETPLAAMYREGREEANLQKVGLIQGDKGWEHAMTFTCKGGTVFVFRSFLPDVVFRMARTMTDETVTAVPTRTLPPIVVDNLGWMIPMLLDNLRFPVLLGYDSTGGCTQEVAGVSKT